ncbi:hypothetical protein ABZ478_37980 [Streptomyces sp. NPDC005706]|uniref:hypothetical protein n=1 Tax=Streptomyces sp. NPDC005706 TaxID=3157169 RepID=UPI0033CC7E04
MTLTATVTIAAVITGSIPHPSLSRAGFQPTLTHLVHLNSALSPMSCDICLVTRLFPRGKKAGAGQQHIVIRMCAPEVHAV